MLCGGLEQSEQWSEGGCAVKSEIVQLNEGFCNAFTFRTLPEPEMPGFTALQCRMCSFTAFQSRKCNFTTFQCRKCNLKFCNLPEPEVQIHNLPEPETLQISQLPSETSIAPKIVTHPNSFIAHKSKHLSLQFIHSVLANYSIKSLINWRREWISCVRALNPFILNAKLFSTLN